MGGRGLLHAQSDLPRHPRQHDPGVTSWLRRVRPVRVIEPMPRPATLPMQ
jgi:hypothetical protein